MFSVSPTYQLLGRWLFIVILLWHMAAVWFVSIPFHAPDPVSTWIRHHLVPLVEPYIYLTSHWQRWWVFVRERPPTENVYFVQYLDKNGEELALLPTTAAGIKDINPHCTIHLRPAAVRLISRAYLGIDHHLPARSPLFAPHGWEKTLMHKVCSSPR